MNVLATGAASGIGRATCLRLARDGRARGQAAKIAAVDLGSSPGLDGLIEELRALGAEAVSPPAATDAGPAPIARPPSPRRRIRGRLRPPYSSPSPTPLR